MNYRHAFHAGNFADVMKHAVLSLILEHLKKKDKPFRVVDTHAGAGLYCLSHEAASRAGEWRNGIARIHAAVGDGHLPPDVRELLSPYLSAIASAAQGANLQTPSVQPLIYPGSPVIARTFMRPGDRLIANELHEADGALLKKHFARDRQVSVMHQDAWLVLKATLPPKERRGVVLVDPPFEQPGEFDRLVEGIRAATRRFATGIYVLWYPLKDPGRVSAFHRAMLETGLPRLLDAQLIVRAPGPGRHRSAALYGSGLLLHNPPYGLDSALEILLPALAEVLGGSDAGADVTWLSQDA